MSSIQIPSRTSEWFATPDGTEAETTVWNPMDLIGGAGADPLADFLQTITDPNPSKHLKLDMPTNNGLSNYPPEAVFGAAHGIKVFTERADNARLSINYTDPNQGEEGNLGRGFFALDLGGAGPVEKIESNGYLIYSMRIPVGDKELLVIWSPRTDPSQGAFFVQHYPPDPWGEFVLPDGPSGPTTWRLAPPHGNVWIGDETTRQVSGDRLLVFPGPAVWMYRTDEEILPATIDAYTIAVDGVPMVVVAKPQSKPVLIDTSGTLIPSTLEPGDTLTLRVLARVKYRGKEHIKAEPV